MSVMVMRSELLSACAFPEGLTNAHSIGANTTSRHFHHQVPCLILNFFPTSMMRRMKIMSKLKQQHADEVAEAAEAII